MGMIEELSALGADVDDAITRFGGKTELYERMLKKLPKMLGEVPVIEYVRSGDLDTALENAHTIKGVVGNLSLTPLFEGYTAAVEQYHEGDFDRARATLEQTLEAQRSIVDCINKYI